MTYHGGLDVSPGETAICVIDATGASVEEMRAEVAPGALDDALVRLDLPLERVGMAACSLAAWLHDGLAEAGWPAICIEAQQAAPWGCGDPTASRGAAMKTMPHESDRNNARALLWGAGCPQPRTVAQIMRTGWFHRVHVKSRQSRRWRSLLVARRMVSPHMRSIGNAIGREDGLEHGAPSRDELAVRVRELAVAEPESMALLEPLLAVPASLLEELARLTKRVLDSVEAEATCRQLLTSPRRGLPAASLPGIGSMAFWPSMHRPDHCADLSGYHRPAGTLGEVA